MVTYKFYVEYIIGRSRLNQYFYELFLPDLNYLYFKQNETPSVLILIVLKDYLVMLEFHLKNHFSCILYDLMSKIQVLCKF